MDSCSWSWSDWHPWSCGPWCWSPCSLIALTLAFLVLAFLVMYFWVLASLVIFLFVGIPLQTGVLSHLRVPWRVFGQNGVDITWNNEQRIQLVKQLMTGIRSFIQKWHNTVILLRIYANNNREVCLNLNAQLHDWLCMSLTLSPDCCPMSLFLIIMDLWTDENYMTRWLALKTDKHFLESAPFSQGNSPINIKSEILMDISGKEEAEMDTGDWEKPSSERDMTCLLTFVSRRHVERRWSHTRVNLRTAKK